MCTQKIYKKRYCYCCCCCDCSVFIFFSYMKCFVKLFSLNSISHQKHSNVCVHALLIETISGLCTACIYTILLTLERISLTLQGHNANIQWKQSPPANAYNSKSNLFNSHGFNTVLMNFFVRFYNIFGKTTKIPRNKWQNNTYIHIWIKIKQLRTMDTMIADADAQTSHRH